MDFAIDLNRDDRAAAAELLSGVTWNQPQGRSYFIAPLRADHPLLQGYRRAFYVRVPPGGGVHRHTDEAAKISDTDHIVIATNDRAYIGWIDPDTGMEREVHLALGHRYRVIDRGVVHWSMNNGDTDRVHLLIEYPKDFSRAAAESGVSPPPGAFGRFVNLTDDTGKEMTHVHSRE